MRFVPWLHVSVAALTIVGAAHYVSAKQRTPVARAVPPLPAGAVSISGSAAVGSGDAVAVMSDIPEWQPGPPTFAVTAFENHAAAKSLDWMITGTPFEIAEKVEAVLGLDCVGGPFALPAGPVPADAPSVAVLANSVGAHFVFTGWYDRPNWQERLVVTLWKVTAQNAEVVAQSQRTGEPKTYHHMLGEIVAELAEKAGIAVDISRRQQLQRVLATDLYAVDLMGRGLSHLIAANAAPANPAGATLRGNELRLADHDLTKSVLIDPKLYEAQRLLGELALAVAPGDPRSAARAAAKFNYANDLAPDDIASLRAAAHAAALAGKPEVALELFRKLVVLRPWDLDARYQLGNAIWQTGNNATIAQRQLEQVTSHMPDHLQARRVLVLIHSAHSDTKQLVSELEAIAVRAPDDLDIKADLASAYGAMGQWAKAMPELETIANARPNDFTLLVRLGDCHRKSGDIDGAIAWYGRAQKLVPELSLPSYLAAQSLFDAGRWADAKAAYNALLLHSAADSAAAEHALGALALLERDGDTAAWYLRRAVRSAPRNLLSRRAVIAAELMRKDKAAAAAQLAPALAAWPNDAVLHYLAGIMHVYENDRGAADNELAAAIAADPQLSTARAALGALSAGGAVTLEFAPELVRPWGDAEAVQAALDRYAAIANAMASVRADYQSRVLELLGTVGRGPMASTAQNNRSCPVARLATGWDAAQRLLARYERLGVELEDNFRFIMRHDEVGATVGLLPNARVAVNTTKKAFRIALADSGELRSEWSVGLAPELRAIGCTDRLLAAAFADPKHYQIIEEDKAEVIPAQTAARAKARATFYVDNTQCPYSVGVWIDGTQVGEVAPGQRSALVADSGQRALCLLGPSTGQCGDRGTVRLVYLHDGWNVTMYCPR